METPLLATSLPMAQLVTLEATLLVASTILWVSLCPLKGPSPAGLHLEGLGMGYV